MTSQASQASSVKEAPRRRKVPLRVKLLALAVGIVMAGFVGEIFARVYDWAQLGRGSDGEQQRLEGKIARYDPLIGVRLLPDAKARLVGPEFDTPISTNAGGLRMDRDVAYGRDSRKRRILVIGDSFTFGHGVGTDERFGDLVESGLPDREVVNMGVQGTGTDQQYLLYREEGHKYEPDLVVLCYLTMNLKRNVATRYSNANKPRFELRDGALVLTNVPVPEEEPQQSDDATKADPLPTAKPKRVAQANANNSIIGRIKGVCRYSALYRLLVAKYWDLRIHLRNVRNPYPYPEYDESNEAWKVTTALFEKFAEEARANGSDFLVVLIPNEIFVQREVVSDKPHEMLKRFCVEHGIAVLDLLPDLKALEQSTGEALYFPIDGHWNQRGHQVAANLILDYLRERPPEALDRPTSAER